MNDAFFTVGHSNRPIESFLTLLQEAEVRLVADVRTLPRSRANPQFNCDALETSLASVKIAYEPIGELGGLRARERAVPPTVNAFWENERFHNYADYAMGEAFSCGFRRLRELGRASRCAIMCAEAVWWRCHRRIIADYLIAAGEPVYHILSQGRIEEARLTSVARRMPNGTLVYPAEDA